MTIDQSALQNAIAQWRLRQTGWAYTTDDATWSIVQRNATDVAQTVLDNVFVDEIRLAGFLRSPDGVLLRALVEQTLPPTERHLAQLLTDAILIAADAAQRQARVAAGLATLAAVTIGLLMFSLR